MKLEIWSAEHKKYLVEVDDLRKAENPQKYDCVITAIDASDPAAFRFTDLVDKVFTIDHSQTPNASFIRTGRLNEAEMDFISKVAKEYIIQDQKNAV